MVGLKKKAVKKKPKAIETKEFCKGETVEVKMARWHHWFPATYEGTNKDGAKIITIRLQIRLRRWS